MIVIQVLGYTVNNINDPVPILRERLLKTIEVVKQLSSEYTIIVSGGNPEGLSERNQANFMKKWLVENNLPEDNILLEGKSLSTIEQLLFLREYISNPDIDRVIIIGTEGGYKKRISLLAKYLIPENIDTYIEGATLPSDITSEEKAQFTKGEEERYQFLQSHIVNIEKGMDIISILQEMVNKHRDGDSEYFHKIGYTLSSDNISER